MIRILLPLALIFLGSESLQSQSPATPDGWRWNKGRGYLPFKSATAEGITLDNTSPLPLHDTFRIPGSVTDFTLSFRASNAHAHPQKKYPFIDSKGAQQRVASPAWSTLLLFNSSDTIRLSIYSATNRKIGNELTAHPAEAAKVVISSALSPSSLSVMLDESNFNPYSGLNYWEIKKTDSTLFIYTGDVTPVKILELRLPDHLLLSGFGFEANPGALINVSDIALIPSNKFYAEISPLWKGEEEFNRLLKKGSDPMEGYWAVFDRDLEESLLKPGGNYRMAMIRDGKRYLLIFLDGALINSKKWRQGMVKAILTPSLFPNIFNVEWIDAEGNPLSESIVAQSEENGILSIQFPYHNSSLRLRKIIPH